MNKIPRHHSWCSHCINPDGYYRDDDGPYCQDHRGPYGEPVEYTGEDAYEPSEWVLSVVGKRFSHPNWTSEGPPTRVAVCTGYDPRHGFRSLGGFREGVLPSGVSRILWVP
jgi:hypothetical protein